MANQATEPRITFVIGGVQKGGTTALAQYLAAHPGIRLPAGKEAHVFDAPGFDDAWDAATVDAQYAAHFPQHAADVLLGDATPFYLFHPDVVARIARYNPGMRWIILLRDPATRALSQFNMERERGRGNRARRRLGGGPGNRFCRRHQGRLPADGSHCRGFGLFDRRSAQPAEAERFSGYEGAPVCV